MLEKIFNYKDNQVRMVLVGDEPYWVAKDVCDILEIGNITKSISRLEEDEFTTSKVTDSTGRKQNTYVVNESGLYELIFNSRKPEAKSFKKWVKQVLKEIRTNGVYVSDEATHDQVIYHVDTFLANLDNYSITKLYGLIEGFLSFHRDKKTRLPFKRSHKARHGNRKYKNHIQSMEEIRDILVDYLNAKIQAFNSSNQAGLAQEYIRIREMVRVSVENMRFRSAACSK